MKQDQKVYEAPAMTVLYYNVESCILADSNIDQGTLGEEDGD